MSVPQIHRLYHECLSCESLNKKSTFHYNDRLACFFKAVINDEFLFPHQEEGSYGGGDNNPKCDSDALGNSGVPRIRIRR